MFFKNKEIKLTNVADGVSRKILAADGSLMAVEVNFDKASVGALHTHPHEQISYVVEGVFEYTIEDEMKVLSKGDSCYVAPNLSHGVVALENGKIFDVFAPQREDFL